MPVEIAPVRCTEDKSMLFDLERRARACQGKPSVRLESDRHELLLLLVVILLLVVGMRIERKGNKVDS